MTCKASLPTTRKDWAELQPLVAGAIEEFLKHESTRKLLKMEASEDALTTDLRGFLKKHFDAKFGDNVWDLTANHNRVLEDGKKKKQPTEYLLDAIDQFCEIRNGPSSPFKTYLDQFTADQANPKNDDLGLAYGYIYARSKTVAQDTTAKNLTKPDLIIHELGCLTKIEHNLIAIEIKPQWSQLPFYKLVDLARMKAFTETKEPPDHETTPTYQYGLFLYFTTEGFDCGWRFENGVSDPVAFRIE